MSIRLWKNLKEYAGVILKDWPRYADALGGKRLQSGDPAWVHLRNRIETLEPNPDGPGVKCNWQFSSRLHACDVIPAWGNRILKRVLTDWTFAFEDQLKATDGPPQVSFLIAHSGRNRLPQLCEVIRSAFAQEDVSLEVIVTDLTPDSIAKGLPSGTICQHVKTTHLPPGWRKSWAFNIAARKARGEILVFHDGDVCMPNRYAAELVRIYETGKWDAASIQRFMFYLNPEQTRRLYLDADFSKGKLEAITQNWKGGTISIRREAFFELGGFDEGFVDWGGEDDEFYDRCGALRHCRYGYVPFLHLWHEPQSGKHSTDNPNIIAAMPQRLGIPAIERRQELVQRDFGNTQHPDPAISYKERWSADQAEARA